MARRLRAEIYGKVQGVGFRAFTCREAQRLGLTGWVRNRPDGSVEVLVEGEEPALRLLLQRISKGPPAARVREIRTLWEEARGEDREFSLRW